MSDYRGPVVVTVSGEKIALCIVDLVSIIPTADVLDAPKSERAYGKWAWELANPRRCVPVAVRGQLGLWRWQGELPAVLQAVHP